MYFLDSETCLIKPGEQIPELVCVSYKDARGSGVLAGDKAKRYVFRALSSGRPCVFHNASFDLAVFMRAYGRPMWELVIDALEYGRIFDTEIAAKLLSNFETGKIKTGEFSLAKCAKRELGVDLDKDPDGWRTRFNELLYTPVGQWPKRAYEYALADAEVLEPLYNEYQRRAETSGVEDLFEPMAHEVYTSVALQHVRAWGLKADGRKLLTLEHELLAKLRQTDEPLKQAGLLKDTGTKNQKALQELVEKHFGAQAPRTPKGAVRYGAEFTNQIDTSPAAKMYVQRCKLEKNIAFVQKLWKAVEYPLHPYINTMVSTGRTSMGDSVQQLPRTGGIRECIVPREGNSFIDVDYSSAELRTWAQLCWERYGFSSMAKLYMENPYADPYALVAYRILGKGDLESFLKLRKSGDTAANEARQVAKVVVLGYPGGMGAKTLAAQSTSRYWKTFGEQGAKMSQLDAEMYKRMFKEAYPEHRPWFIDAERTSSKGLIRLRGSGMYRGGMTYCEAANNPFQHLSGYGAKRALINLFKACYFDTHHPLFGCRPVHFMHDQITVEAPEDAAGELQVEVENIMVNGMMEATPDIPCVVEGEVKNSWSK